VTAAVAAAAAGLAGGVRSGVLRAAFSISSRLATPRLTSKPSMARARPTALVSPTST
jgi:hypothetical protein